MLSLALIWWNTGTSLRPSTPPRLLTSSRAAWKYRRVSPGSSPSPPSAASAAAQSLQYGMPSLISVAVTPGPATNSPPPEAPDAVPLPVDPVAVPPPTEDPPPVLLPLPPPGTDAEPPPDVPVPDVPVPPV